MKFHIAAVTFATQIPCLPSVASHRTHEASQPKGASLMSTLMHSPGSSTTAHSPAPPPPPFPSNHVDVDVESKQRWLARGPSHTLPGDDARVFLQHLLFLRRRRRRRRRLELQPGRRRSTPVRGRTSVGRCREGRRRRRHRRPHAGSWFRFFRPRCRCEREGFGLGEGRFGRAEARGQVGRGGCRRSQGAAVAAAGGGGSDRGRGLARGL